MKLTQRDKYLRKKFEITEKEFNAAFAKQGSVCSGCSKPPTNRSLHVDHDHAIEGWKIETKKLADKKWIAYPKDGYNRLEFTREGTTKPEAMAKVRKKLKRLSVRGILCWRCNTGLRKYDDDPVRFHNMAIYLDNYYDFVDELQDDRNGFPE